jgi:hypothetical protein
MLLGGEGEVRLAADHPLLAVALFVEPFRHVRRRQVGDAGQQRLQFLGDRLLRRFGLRHLVLEAGDLGHGGSGVLALGLQLPDLLGELIAASLHFLPARLSDAALGIEGNDLGGQWRQVTARAAAIESLGILPNPFDVKHVNAPPDS